VSGLFLCQDCRLKNKPDTFSNALNPDLRYSPINADAAAWKSVVIDGARTENGMISFAEVYNEDDTEAMRAYVVRQAHEQPE